MRNVNESDQGPTEVMERVEEDFGQVLQESEKDGDENVLTTGDDNTDGRSFQEREEMPRAKTNSTQKYPIIDMFKVPMGAPRLAPIESLKLKKPFVGLFDTKPQTLEAITKDMVEHGFDDAHPVIVEQGTGRVIDGVTRVRAARAANLKVITVVDKVFDNDDEALDYAIKCQLERRNMSDAEILKFVEFYHNKRPRGGDRRSSEAVERSKVSNEKIETSAEQTAEKLGISPAKVKRTLSVIKHADEDTRAAVESGGMSIHMAHTKLSKKWAEQKGDKSSYFRLLKPPRWFHAEWEPVLAGDPDDDPKYVFVEEALKFLRKQKPGKIVPASPSRPNVLACAGLDILAPDVPDKIVNDVINGAVQAPGFDLIILTKHMTRTAPFDVTPNNVVFGTVISNRDEYLDALNAFDDGKPHIKLAIIDPGDTPFEIDTLKPFRWIVVKSGEGQWLETLLNIARSESCRVFFDDVVITPKELQAQLVVVTKRVKVEHEQPELDLCEAEE